MTAAALCVPFAYREHFLDKEELLWRHGESLYCFQLLECWSWSGLRWDRRWNSYDAVSMAQIYHADCKIFVGPLGMELDRTAMTALNEMYFSAFPDGGLEEVRTIELSDSWMLTEFVARSTHQGTFFGIPPSGYACETKLVWLTHYTDDGLVIEGSFYYDNLTLVNQMTTAPWSLDGIWITTVPTPLGQPDYDDHLCGSE